jgi:hypothetical protein
VFVDLSVLFWVGIVEVVVLEDVNWIEGMFILRQSFSFLYHSR